MPPPTTTTTTTTEGGSKGKRFKIYSFPEARRIARGYGFETEEEYLEYCCPGAYKLPKNPHEVWKDEWKGWDDWLGVCCSFQEGRSIARSLGMKQKEAYIALMERPDKIDEDNPCSRLPFRPDLQYKREWTGWNDWLGIDDGVEQEANNNNLSSDQPEPC